MKGLIITVKIKANYHHLLYYALASSDFLKYPFYLFFKTSAFPDKA